MSKKQLTQQLSKEDCRRCNEGLPSIASQILDSEQFESMTNMIKKKCKPNEEASYLKTGDAWYKRFQTVTVAELRKAVDIFINNDNNLSSLPENKEIDISDIALPSTSVSLAQKRAESVVSLGNTNKPDVLLNNDDSSVVSLSRKSQHDNSSVVSSSRKSQHENSSLVSLSNNKNDDSTVILLATYPEVYKVIIPGERSW